VRPSPEESTLLRVRAEAARRAIRAGADPHLSLAEVVWPSRKVLEACEGLSRKQAARFAGTEERTWGEAA
jgi:hypothetical protein